MGGVGQQVAQVSQYRQYYWDVQALLGQDAGLVVLVPMVDFCFGGVESETHAVDHSGRHR